MRVHHLNCGTMCPAARPLINGTGRWSQAGEMVCHCLLLETDSGLVLVDTGFGTHDLLDPAGRVGPIRHLLRAEFDVRETAIEQVVALGFEARDVRHLIVTHLDIDHAGGLSDFPEATVHLLAAEKRHAVDAPDRAAKLRYRSAQWSHRPKWQAYEPNGEPWNGFECVRDLSGLPPEILLVPLAGHTRGHTCVAVQQADGWLLHCGDAYFSRKSIEGQAPPLGIRIFQRAAAMSSEQMLSNQARLRSLHASESSIRLFSAHDASELAALRDAR